MPAVGRVLLHACAALALGVVVYAATASGLLPAWLFIAIVLLVVFGLGIGGAMRQTRRLEKNTD